MRKTLAISGLAVVIVGLVAMAGGARTKPGTVSRDLNTLTCQPEPGEDMYSMPRGTLDYLAGTGSATAEAALRSGLVTLRMPDLTDRVVKVAANSAVARFEVPEKQAVFITVKMGSKWVLDTYSLCESLAKQYYRGS